MTKVRVSLTLDYDIVAKHKAQGNNMSDLCNTFLGNYGLNSNRLTERAVLKAADLVEAVEGEKIKAGRDRELRQMLIEARSLRAVDEDKAHKVLKLACEKFDLDWADAVQRMERA